MRHPDLILAGASVRSLAESVLRIGLVPYCVDQFGDADLAARLAAAGARNNLSVVDSFTDIPAATATLPAEIPLLPVGGLENKAAVMQSLRQQRCVLASSAETLKALRTPSALFPTLRLAGCSVPDFQTVCQNEAQQNRTDESNSPSRWLRKSLDGAGGMSITSATLNDQGSMQPDTFLQERIDGDVVSATFHVNADDQPRDVTALGYALQLSGCPELNAPGFQFCGNVRLPELSPTIQQRFDHIAQSLVSAWPVRGIFGVDTVLRDQQPFVIEVNPRLTASHELYELSADDSSNHIALQLQAFDSTVDMNLSPQSSIIKPDARTIARLVLYADQDRKITGAEQAELLKYCRDFALDSVTTTDLAWWLADIPAAATTVKNATPFCSIYVDLGNAGAFQDAVATLSAMLGGRIVDGVRSICRELQAKIAVLGER